MYTWRRWILLMRTALLRWPRDRSPEPCNALLPRTDRRRELLKPRPRSGCTGSELAPTYDYSLIPRHSTSSDSASATNWPSRGTSRCQLESSWSSVTFAHQRVARLAGWPGCGHPRYRGGQVVASWMSGRGMGSTLLDEEAEAQCAGDDDDPGEEQRYLEGAGGTVERSDDDRAERAADVGEEVLGAAQCGDGAGVDDVGGQAPEGDDGEGRGGVGDGHQYQRLTGMRGGGGQSDQR